MPVSKKAEKQVEAKYDVVYHYPNLELHAAAVTGNVGMVHYALTHGQPVNSILHGLLPIHAACSGGSEQVVRMLIDRGADVNAPRLPRRYLDSKQESIVLGHAGSTPLHFAAANGHDKIVRILLACGAVQKPDKFGNTPEIVAERTGHPDIAETLRAWEAMLDEEREKVQDREEEEKKDLARRGSHGSLSLDPEAVADEEEDEDYISPTLDKAATWKGKGRAASFSEKQQRMKIRRSLDHMFGGRRGGSLRVASGKGDKSDGAATRRGESLDLARTDDDSASHQSEEHRRSLPGLFGKVAHPQISLREALHRKSHASDAGTDIHLFRGRPRTADSDESTASGPSLIKQLSKQSLLQLFRRGNSGSPPSLSPSPPRTAVPSLPTGDLDESVDRIKRLSIDGIRPTSGGLGRPRSGSQVNFQIPLVSRTSSAAGSFVSCDQSGTSTGLSNGAELDDNSAIDDESGDRPVDTSAAMQRRLSSSSGLKPLSRIDTQLANGKQGDSDEKPKSILKTRTEGAPSPESPRGFARLSPWHEPSTPSPLGGQKPRSATMPTSYFSSPLSPKKSDERKSPAEAEDAKVAAGSGNEESPDFDRREREDGIGESIWDRAAARRSAKGRSRGASLTSVVSSAISTAPQVPPLTFGMSSLSEPEGTDWTLPSIKPAARASSTTYRHGRPRNNTVSTMSTMASAGSYSTETGDSNLTPASVSSSHFTPGSSIRPPSEDGLSVKERLVRRVSKRRGDTPDLLYTLPIKKPSDESSGDLQVEKAKYQAVERRRKTEQDIIRAVTGPRNDSSVSLAEQLAAYGDIMAMEASLTQDSHDGTPSDLSSSEQVSRSYIPRPALNKSDSTDSNATIKTENSRMMTKAGKARSVPVSTTHSRNGSLVGSKAGSNNSSADEKRDKQAREEALRLVPALDTLFSTHAPSTAIPSINRIYETRAAAYRDKGLALMKEAPLYGSSAKNPSRPPVSIEDHWLMAGLKQTANPQSRQQRAVSTGSASLPAQRQNIRFNDSSAPTMDVRDTAVPSKAVAQSGTSAKMDATTRAVIPAPSTLRVGSAAPVRGAQSNGAVNMKPYGDIGATAFTNNSRRRATAPVDNISPLDPGGSGGGMTSQPSWDSGTGKGLKKSEQVTSNRYPLDALDTRRLSDADQTPTPTSTASSVPTPLAAGHKSRWGDGLKTAMRLGKSRT